MTGILYRSCVLILGMQQSVTTGRLGKTCTLHENEQINEKVNNNFALFLILCAATLFLRPVHAVRMSLQIFLLQLMGCMEFSVSVHMVRLR